MWFKYGLKAQKVRSFCPLPLLYPSASDFQFPSAGDRWFRACCLRLACVLFLLFPSAEEIKMLKAEM